MIAQLTGTVVEIRPTSMILEVSGVGFSVICSPNTTAGLHPGDHVRLHTHLVVREDSLTLYGFVSPEETTAFVLVQSVTGIGPKLALAIVSHLTVAELRQAILTENLVMLSRTPGVGSKVAQRLALELKDKVASLPTSTEPALIETSDWRDQVVSGLQGLGYSARDSEAAWESIREMASAQASVSDLMRAALRSLAKG